ncbi:hypothetical protein LY474_40625 [Myxococcus stipitatus]|uniref:hypothetical protein n=1 Tax=Myxococcus stipitatus TaxID=83455 RepID=UPI001F2D66DE|nr:hypothetical protein [Myxococcus stipitatus]MCE9674114.1 hypothetical protein [Myxococcus stipitatus]
MSEGLRTEEGPFLIEGSPGHEGAVSLIVPLHEARGAQMEVTASFDGPEDTGSETTPLRRTVRLSPSP